MPETLVDRFKSATGLVLELVRQEDTPEGCLLCRRRLWGDVVEEKTISESQANGLMAWALEVGFENEQP